MVKCGILRGYVHETLDYHDRDNELERRRERRKLILTLIFERRVASLVRAVQKWHVIYVPRALMELY